MRKSIFLISGLLFVLAMNSICSATEPKNIKVKMIALNPSETEEKVVPVKAYLPNGLTPSDFVDLEDFEMNYDTENNLYYVFQEVCLKPGASVALEVEIRDIWVIPDEELQILKAQVANILDVLQKSPFYGQAKILGKSVKGRIGEIIEKQNMEGVSIEDRISYHRRNVASLSEIKKDVGVLEDLVIQEGGLPGEKLVGEAVESTDSAPRAERGDLNADSRVEEAVKFKIIVSNAEEGERTTSVKYYFPVEVLPEYVLDRGGLDIAYDNQKGKYYIFKNEISLDSLEKKEFIVTVKNIWQIPLTQLEPLKIHAQKMMDMLRSSEYDTIAASLFSKIVTEVNVIEDVQSNHNVSVEQFIGNYRANNLRFSDAKKDMARLERLVIQAGGSPGMIVAAIDIKRKERGIIPASGAVSGPDLKNGPRGATKWMEMVGKTIFRGKAPSNTTTWKIIYTIVIFLGILSVSVFVVVMIQQRVSQIDPLTGTSNRNFTYEKLRQDFKSYANKKKKFSVLLMDVDKFKKINDQHGHSTGDLILRQFVILVRKAIRQEDLLGRIGGDEFLVILSEADKKVAQTIAERIRDIVCGHTVKVRDESLHVTTSVGIATFPDDADTMQELLGKADSAMYAAKNKGGNGIEINV